MKDADSIMKQIAVTKFRIEISSHDNERQAKWKGYLDALEWVLSRDD